MGMEEKLDIDLFKVVTRAIAQSDHLEMMTDHLSQLLVAALGIKGCSIFALNHETEELEILGSFGLSISYVNKGPVLTAKSIARTVRGEPIVVSDITRSDLLQYPEEAKAEGVRAIVSLPVKLRDRVIGVLRLYHHDTWNLSVSDLDSLLVLAEIIGLALVYTRLRLAVRSVKESVNEIHEVWLES
jgi:signal transduction protein with GAF and PtsI domain